MELAGLVENIEIFSCVELHKNSRLFACIFFTYYCRERKSNAKNVEVKGVM